MTDKIKSLFDGYTGNQDFSGAALIKQGDRPLFEYAAGFAHRGFQIPNTVSTKFDTASITKLFTAAGILFLESRGKIRLSDKITDIIDLAGTEIPADVEIHHLLTHTSGIADDADEESGESYSALFSNSPNYALRNNADYLKNFAYKKPNFKAGTDVRYNNCAFILLGLAIEKITGQSYRDYITENIFEPFGMERTRFHAMDEADAEIAEGYFLSKDSRGQSVWKKNIYSYPPIGAADSGAYTTVYDLDSFMRKVKASPVFGKMMHPQCEFFKDSRKGRIRFGYAFEFVEIEGRLFSMYKEGCNDGVCNMFCYYPESDTTFTVLTNQDCHAWKLFGEAQNIIMGK